MALSEKKRRWFEAHTGQLTIAFVTQHSAITMNASLRAVQYSEAQPRSFLFLRRRRCRTALPHADGAALPCAAAQSRAVQ